MRDQNTVRAGWSRRVRDELLEHFTKSEKCRRAELTAVMLLAPQNVRYDGNTGIFLYEETQNSGKNHFTDRHKTYNIKGDLELTEDEIAYLEAPYVPHPLAGVMAQNRPANAGEKHVWSTGNQKI